MGGEPNALFATYRRTNGLGCAPRVTYPQTRQNSPCFLWTSPSQESPLPGSLSAGICGWLRTSVASSHPTRERIARTPVARARLSGRPINAATTSRSFHPGTVQAVLVDGSVPPIPSTMKLSVWRSLATRAGGEVLPSF